MAIQFLGYIAPPNDSKIFRPTRSVTLGAGESTQIEFFGLNADPFGIKSVLFDQIGGDLSKTIVTARHSDNDAIVFDKCSVEALRNLFYMSELLTPVIVKRGYSLKMSIENTSSEGIEITVLLNGMDKPWIERFQDEYEQKYGTGFPTPRIISTFLPTLAASTSRYRSDLIHQGKKLEFRKMAVSAQKPQLARLEIQQRNKTVRKEIPFSLLNAEFEGRRSAIVYNTYPKEALELYFTNNDTSSQTLNFVAEAYEVNI